MGSQPGEAAPQRQGEAQVSAAPAVFRSDEELWPAELRPAKPILPAARAKMRRLFLFHSRRISEAESDMKEAADQADSYARSCPAEKELRAFIDSVKKEVAKYRKEWVGSVQQLLAGDADGQPAEKRQKTSSGAQ